MTEDRPSPASLRAAFISWLDEGGTSDVVILPGSSVARPVRWLLEELMDWDGLTIMTPNEWELVNRWVAHRHVRQISLRQRSLNVRPVTYGQAAELILAIQRADAGEGEELSGD